MKWCCDSRLRWTHSGTSRKRPRRLPKIMKKRRRGTSWKGDWRRLWSSSSTLGSCSTPSWRSWFGKNPSKIGQMPGNATPKPTCLISDLKRPTPCRVFKHSYWFYTGNKIIMYTVRRPLSHEVCYVFDRKFQFLDGLPNSCSISLLAGRTWQKRFTKYYDYSGRPTVYAVWDIIFSFK